MLQGIRRTSEPGTIAALHAQALAEHGRHSSVAAITEGWQDLPHTRFLVAEEAGTPIAFLAYREEEGGSCQISDLFVCHSRRRRGLARRLLQMVTDDFACGFGQSARLLSLSTHGFRRDRPLRSGRSIEIGHFTALITVAACLIAGSQLNARRSRDRLGTGEILAAGGARRHSTIGHSGYRHRPVSLQDSSPGKQFLLDFAQPSHGLLRHRSVILVPEG